MSRQLAIRRFRGSTAFGTAILAGLLLGLGCGGGVSQAVHHPQAGPPSWLSDPTRHPDYPPDRFICRVGSSRESGRDAERAAYRHLADQLDADAAVVLHRIVEQDAAWQRDDAFQYALERAMTRSGQLIATWMARSETGPYRRRGTWFALACLDRGKVRERLSRRESTAVGQAQEAERQAIAAANERDWFAFARQIHAMRASEAERLALVARRHALLETERPRAPGPSVGSPALRAAADSLRKWTGWTLRTEFRWEGSPPPPSFPLRLKDRIMRVPLQERLRIGFGTGCPKHVPPEEDEESEEAGTHYVVRVRINGSSSRTAIASWDIAYELAMEVRRCEGGVEIPSRLFGRITGSHDRDPGTAYLASLSGGRLDTLVTRAFREIDLILPAEITGNGDFR